MHRARFLVAQCVRENARRRLVAPTGNALRALTDSGQIMTAAEQGLRPVQGDIERAAGAAGAAVVVEDDQNTHRSEDYGSRLEEVDHLEHDAALTPAQELTSRLRRLRTVKGPGHLNEGMQILAKARKEAVPRDITCYNILIKMIAMERWVMTDKTKPAMVGELLRMIEEDALAKNLHTYNGIIFVYAKAQALAKAERAYDEMVSGGVEPNAITLSYMAMAQAWGSSSAMYRTLATMDAKGWTPNRAAQLSAIASMWQRKDTEGVLKMMQLMFESQYIPTEAAFAVALMSAAQLGRVDFAKVLFDRRNAFGFEPKPEIYSSIMLAHAKADRHEESLGYWRQLVCLDGVGEMAITPATCQAALKSAVVCNQWEEVETIADMLKNQQPGAMEHTYKLAVAACKARSGIDKPDYWQRVERTVQAIQRRTGVPPSPEIMCRLATTYVEGKQWGKAAAVFEQVMDRDVEMFAIRWEGVIQSYFALERFRDVRSTWMKWRTKGGGDLTVRANEVAMRAAHQLLDGDWAKEIMALPANRNNKKGLNPATLMAAVDVLVDSGRPQEAREILKDWRPTETTRINFVIFNALLLCCHRHGGSEMMLEMYQVLRKHDKQSRVRPSTLPLVVQACCELDRAGEVVAMFEEQLAVGYEAEKACYEAVARAAMEAGDEKASAQLLEAARSTGGGPSTAAGESGEGATVLAEADAGGRVRVDAAAVRSEIGGDVDGLARVSRQHQQSSTATATPGAEEQSRASLTAAAEAATASFRSEPS